MSIRKTLKCNTSFFLRFCENSIFPFLSKAPQKLHHKTTDVKRVRGCGLITMHGGVDIIGVIWYMAGTQCPMFVRLKCLA